MVTNILLPIFLILLTGIFAQQSRILNANALTGIEEILAKIILPILVFYTVLGAKFTQDSLHFTLVMTVVMAIVFTLGFVIGKMFGNSLSEASFSAMCASNFNAALIGLPLLVAMLGKRGVVPGTLTVMIVVVIFFPLGMLLVEYDQQKSDDGNLLPALRKLSIAILKNPIIMAIPAGLIVHASGVPIPNPIINYFKAIAACATGLALFAVGYAIDFSQLKQVGIQALVISLLKTVLMPLIVLGVMYYFDMPRIYAIAGVTTAAIPTAKMVYILASKYETAHQESAITVTLTTLLSFVTLPLFISWCLHLFPA